MKALMKNPRLLVFLVFFLLVSNILVLSYFMFWKQGTRNTNRNENGMVDHMKKELGLTEDQAASYKKLLQDHRSSIKQQGDSLKKAKSAFYNLALQEVTDSTIKVQSEALAARQVNLYLTMLQHFKRVRSLCSDEQRPKFDSMLVNMINRSSRFNRAKTNNN